MLDKARVARDQKVMAQFLADCGRARKDVRAFFEHCMLEENTQQKIQLAPHQDVGLKFMMDHDRSVNMWPVGCAKSFTVAAITTWLIGQNPTLRGAIVSATRDQASKPLAMVSDYIQHNPRVKAVFPHLRKSIRQGDPWTQHEITVDRPPGIRDATLIAHGIDSGTITGSRLNWIVVDDILNRENTSTNDQRMKVRQWFDNSVLSRLDPKGGKVIVINTAWHPDDLIHYLEKIGWATMRMDILGGVEVQDDRERERACEIVDVPFEPWDHPGLRPATTNPYETKYRLKAHDPDPKNEVPLWPERYPAEWIEKKRREHLPQEFNRLFMNVCREDTTSMCKQAFVDISLAAAEKLKVRSFTSGYKGSNMVFTGIDLAISPGEEHDDTAFFTFEVRDDGTRVILDIDVGQWDGPTILDKLFQKQAAYNSVVRVESNAAQDFLRQFALQKDKSLPIKAHMTGRAKAHPEHGVAGLFLEMANGAWAFPHDRGELHPAMKRFIDACLYYVPSKHTDDTLMACYMAREQAKEWGVLSGGGTANMGQGSIGMSIMSR